MQPVDPGFPPLDAPAQGDSFLALLGDASNIDVMAAVRDRVLVRDELISRLQCEGSTFDRHMRRLKETNLVVSVEMPDDRRRKAYRLAHCGRDLLAVNASVERALAGFAGQVDEMKDLLMKSISDPWDRAIARAVLEAPQQFDDLLRTVRSTVRSQGTRGPDLKAAGLKLRLTRLGRLGMVAQSSTTGLCQPGPNLWLLGRPAATMARWRWRWTPDNVPRIAGDLAGVVRMVAGRVRVPQATEVRVVMHVIPPPGMEPWPDVVVCLTDGRMTLPELTLDAPDAHIWSTPPAWLDSLLEDDRDGIEVEGDPSAAQAVHAGLLEVLGPERDLGAI